MHLLDILAVLLRAGGGRCAGGTVDDDERATIQEREEQGAVKRLAQAATRGDATKRG